MPQAISLARMARLSAPTGTLRTVSTCANGAAVLVLVGRAAADGAEMAIVAAMANAVALATIVNLDVYVDVDVRE